MSLVSVYNVIMVVQVFQIHIEVILTGSTHVRISQQGQSVKALKNFQIFALAAILEKLSSKGFHL